MLILERGLTKVIIYSYIGAYFEMVCVPELESFRAFYGIAKYYISKCFIVSNI